MRVALAVRSEEEARSPGGRAGPLRAAALAALLLVAVLASCAEAPLVDAPSGPPPFRGLRRVLLVRAGDRPEPQRHRDPLDAVRESLEADGRTTRTVEVGRKAPRELAEMERLYAEIEGRVEEGGMSGEAGRPVERLRRPVAGVLDAAQADGAVLLYRLGARPLLPAPSASPFSHEPAPRLARPAGALALVDRDGNLLWFDWGVQRDPLEGTGGASAPATSAAEAVDALLRVVRGDADAPDA